MMKKMQIILMAVLLAAGMGYSAVITRLSENFESSTVGVPPVATYVQSPSSTASVLVVASSPIGSGQAVRVYDQAVGQAAGMDYNFVASAAHQENAIGLKFTYNVASLGLANYTEVGVGEYSTLNSLRMNNEATKYAGFQIRASDGRLRYTLGATKVTMATLGVGTHTVEMFVNDKDSGTVNYVTKNGSAYSLNANSAAFFYDNINVGGTAGVALPGSATDSGTLLNTEWNLGRIGFSTPGTGSGLDVTFDDIQVTALIPEPATTGMLLLGAVTVLAIRRRRA